MRKKLVYAVAMVVGLNVISRVWAHDDKDMKDMKMPPQKAASAEFNQIKQLVGNWKGVTSHPGKKETEPVTVSFKLTAAGSAIEETLMSGTPHEMVDMYVDEGGKLAMTHYCAIGNQPHMVLKQTGPHLISLEMGPSQGINPQDSHMHSLALEFPDANHLTEHWINYQNGQPGDSVIITLARVP